MSGGGFTPTAEQAEALALFATGDDLVIEAGAGTGKTATLRLLAESTDRRGVYVAFNKAIVVEAGAKMPANVSCSTAHSLAARNTDPALRRRLGGARMKSQDIAKLLGLDAIFVTLADGSSKRLAPGYLGGLVQRAVVRFCQTADAEIGARHVPYIDGIDEISAATGARGVANNREVAARLVPALRRAWADATDPAGRLPFRHDHYLKAWQLAGPTIAADFIMFDEAQDANPVMRAIVDAQTHAQRVWVGDSQQQIYCQPPGTMVTVVDQYRRGNRHTGVEPTAFRQVPIEEVRVGDRVVSFDVAKSFLRRMGDEVTAVGPRPYDGRLVTVTLRSGARSAYTPTHRCVVRFGEALSGRWVTCLMRRGSSFRVGIAKGVYGNSLGLPARVAAERADAAWILATHETEADARLAEAIASWSHGVPSLRFVAGTSYGMTQQALDEFWTKVGDLTAAAGRLAAAHGRDLVHPLIAGGSRLYRRRSQIVVACNLIDGMLMLPITGALDADGKQVPIKRWEPIAVGAEWHTGHVYSMDVADRHTYVADGIVTHNSFTGAVNALSHVDGGRSFLTRSFRFGPEVAEVANRVLARLDAELRIEGAGAPGRVGPVPNPEVVLTRTNALAVREALTELAEGGKPAIVGGATEVVRFAEAAESLKAKGWTAHPELACFASWGEVRDYVQNDPSGSELSLMVRLIDEFGADVIVESLSACVSETDATLVLSTAHKAKGREWDRVRLGADFPTGLNNQGEVAEVPEEELRLLYVAATRARVELDTGGNPLLGPADPDEGGEIGPGATIAPEPGPDGSPSAVEPGPATVPAGDTPEPGDGNEAPETARVELGLVAVPAADLRAGDWIEATGVDGDPLAGRLSTRRLVGSEYHLLIKSAATGAHGLAIVHQSASALVGARGHGDVEAGASVAAVGVIGTSGAGAA